MGWDDVPHLGLDRVDEEHRDVLNLINEFEEALRKGKGRELLEKMLDQMVSRMVYHCRNEESLFEQTDYPQAFEHKKAHRDIIDKISDIQSQSRFGFDEDLAHTLYLFLKSFFLGHVQTMDRAYVPYVQEKREKSDKNGL